MRIHALLLLLLLAAACTLAASPAEAAMASAAEARAAGVPLELRVRIPKVLQLRLENHPAGVRVTEQDVARGEVVVRGARVHVAANDRHGFVLRAELRGPAFTGFAVEGLSAVIGCDCRSTQITMPAPGHRTAAPVAYRLRLASDASAGHYSWPLTLSLQDP